jgi:hypothetical protein
MIAHVSIGVRDINRSRAFYDAALAPLGYKCIRAARSMVGYGYGADSISLWVVAAERPVPQTKSRVCISASRRRIPQPWMRFTRWRNVQAGKTTVRPACGRCMVPITTPPSLSIRTDTASKPITVLGKGRLICYCRHVWPRLPFFRCERDQARLFDPAASAHAQLPADLERCAD